MRQQRDLAMYFFFFFFFSNDSHKDYNFPNCIIVYEITVTSRGGGDQTSQKKKNSARTIVSKDGIFVPNGLANFSTAYILKSFPPPSFFREIMNTRKFIHYRRNIHVNSLFLNLNRRFCLNEYQAVSMYKKNIRFESVKERIIEQSRSFSKKIIIIRDTIQTITFSNIQIIHLF